jgi:tetratricopeptide (TPR) repeat protein
LIGQLRAMFAKSGAIEPAIACLVLLAEIEPSHRADHQAELDEILHFADDLAAAENGPEAQRSQPIALLQPTVLALPLPALVERYVGLLEERQRVIAALIDKQGASIQLVRAHQDILYTAHRIAIVLARAGRTQDIAAHLVKLQGLGTNRELAAHAEAVATQPTPDAYLELARSLRTNEHVPDTAAALAVCVAGLAKFPTDPALLGAAAEDAASLGRVDQPIELYEAALRTHGEVDATVALRLGKLYSERIARLAFGGRPAAATTAWHDLSRFTADAEHRAPHQVWAQVAAVGETALGRGLISQGRIVDAEHALVASIDRAPSIDAYETLATLHYKTDRLASASRYATAGLKMLGETSGDRYRRAKLERLAADVLRAAGKTRDAAALYLDSLRTWAGLGETKALPRTVAAERLLDSGRAMWFLGDSGRAVDLVLEAIDVDPDAAATCADAVAFLLEVGRAVDAADALHRGLSSSGISEFYKVYMSLWVLADAHRRGEPRDRQGYEYLSSRHGDLWYEQLAEAATGRLAFPALRSTAATEPRQAELAFYGVMLGLDPQSATRAGARKLLSSVVDARLVMDAEYDLAREYLSQP